MRPRILIAEFSHETNRFSKRPTDLQCFRDRRLLEGDAIIKELRGTNAELAGFIAEAERENWELVPTIAAAAGPSGLVTAEAEAYVTEAILAGLEAQGPCDGILLALHGAMVSETDDDGEGALLAKLRAKVGPDLPIMVTLDLHANVTDRMAELANALISYRTYPHVDLDLRGAEAAGLMRRTLADEIRPQVALARPPTLDGCDDGRTTSPGPMLELLAEARRLEREEPGVLNVSINAGFVDSDIYLTGPTATVTGNGESSLWPQFAGDLAAEIWRRRDEKTVSILSPEEAVAAALAAAGEAAEGAVVIADYADNPGAGAYGDATDVLRLMLEAGMENAAFGGLYDPAAAAQLAAAGVGARVSALLGGKTDPRLGGDPLELTGEVLAISDGHFVYEGPMSTGTAGYLGTTVAWRVGGIDILVISVNTQMLDRALFRSAGIRPEDKAFIGVKSMQHFRGAFEPIAREVLVCDCGALCSADYRSRDFQHLRRPIHPLDPDVDYNP